MQTIVVDFKTWCGLSSMQGAIDGTHVSIAKPLGPFAKDYFYHKRCGYNIVAQAVVDSKKRFIDFFVRLPSSVNDFKLLRQFALYRHVQYQSLFHHDKSISEFPPIYLGTRGTF
jgi:hypothetical protein